MVVNSISAPGMYWRDKVLGIGTFGSSCDEDFEFLDGDVMRSTINGVPAINFSKRVHQILVRDMATTVVVNYLQNLCPGVGLATNIMVGSDSTMGTSSMNDKMAKPTEAFGTLMLVEWKSRHNSRK
ncbi:hypothetical protein Gogos_011664 [Gossypium gossypioides]|uniref:Uncharacterized protein n=1 Tax=Gossypium gossypioides TaxID=34282 RepID=A0A7J9BQ22_GOSGO|nr:hypothetical protein [Gossypium gossypioides]